MSQRVRFGGVVLAGGRSTRMGVDKATLQWDGTPLVVRVASLLARAVDGPVVVAAAPEQVVPPLPAGVELARDRVDGSGPLQGIHTGLDALRGRADIAFVAPCDVPLLHPGVIELLLAALSRDESGESEIAAGLVGERLAPLPSAWRVSLLPAVAAALEEGQRSVGRFAATRRVVTVADEALRAVDPALRSFSPLNTPEELAAARAAEL